MDGWVGKGKEEKKRLLKLFIIGGNYDTYMCTYVGRGR